MCLFSTTEDAVHTVLDSTLFTSKSTIKTFHRAQCILPYCTYYVHIVQCTYIVIVCTAVHTIFALFTGTITRKREDIIFILQKYLIK